MLILMVWANRVLFVLNFCLFGAFFWFWITKGSEVILPGAWEYKDLISVLLTVVTVVLAFIGVIVGGAAIWGYQSIKAIAEEKAETTSKAGCDDYLKSQDFRTQIEAAIRERLESEAKNAVQSALGPAVLAASSSPEFNEPASPIGDDHPEGPKGDEKWRD